MLPSCPPSVDHEPSLLPLMAGIFLQCPPREGQSAGSSSRSPPMLACLAALYALIPPRMGALTGLSAHYPPCVDIQAGLVALYPPEERSPAVRSRIDPPRSLDAPRRTQDSFPISRSDTLVLPSGDA